MLNELRRKFDPRWREPSQPEQTPKRCPQTGHELFYRVNELLLQGADFPPVGKLEVLLNANWAYEPRFEFLLRSVNDPALLQELEMGNYDNTGKLRSKRKTGADKDQYYSDFGEILVLQPIYKGIPDEVFTPKNNRARLADFMYYGNPHREIPEFTDGEIIPRIIPGMFVRARTVQKPTHVDPIRKVSKRYGDIPAYVHTGLAINLTNAAIQINGNFGDSDLMFYMPELVVDHVLATYHDLYRYCLGESLPAYYRNKLFNIHADSVNKTSGEYTVGKVWVHSGLPRDLKPLNQDMISSVTYQGSFSFEGPEMPPTRGWSIDDKKAAIRPFSRPAHSEGIQTTSL